MSAFSNNIFALLDDDVEETLPQSAPEKVVEKKVISKPTDKSRAHPNEARIRSDYPQRGGRSTVAATRGTGEERGPGPRDRHVGPRFDRPIEERTGEFAPRERENSDYRGGGGGGGGGSRELRRGGRGGFRGRGREFDRHSGTGKYDSEKKETVGWGEQTTAWEEGEKNVAAEAASDAIEAEVKAEDETTDHSTYKPEPEEIVKTLDEYFAERAAKSLSVSLPEARQPNEGSDDSTWKDAVPLEEEEDEDVFIVGKEQAHRLKNKNKKEKVFLEIEQRFTPRPGGGGGRGRSGRGGPGGGPGSGLDGETRSERPPRGAYRGTRSGGRVGRHSNGVGAEVDVDDVEAFPSLGSR